MNIARIDAMVGCDDECGVDVMVETDDECDDTI